MYNFRIHISHYEGYKIYRGKLASHWSDSASMSLRVNSDCWLKVFFLFEVS